MPFDLSALETVDATEVEITDLTGDPMGVVITLAGPYSEVVEEAQRLGEQRLQRFRRRIGNPRKLSLAQEEEHQRLVRELVTDKLVAATLGWKTTSEDQTEQTVLYQGKVVECTPENVRMIYENVPSLKEQVAAAFADEANFTRR